MAVPTLYEFCLHSPTGRFVLPLKPAKQHWLKWKNGIED